MGQAQVHASNKYGYPDAAYQSKHMTLWYPQQDFPWMANVINTATGKPVTRVFINKDFLAKVKVWFKALEEGCLYKEIKTWDGCFVQRPVRGRSVLSLHGWGLAIDLNAATEKMGDNKTFWSKAFLARTRECGIHWGGDWTSIEDSMHFAYYNG